MLLNNEFLHESFLYATNETFDNVFRMIIRMKEPVDGQALNRAVAVTVKRYPYFTVRLVKSGDGYDVVYNPNPVPVVASEQPLCLGTEQANYHYFSVGYAGREIYLDVYHSLTDAAGVTPMAKTLIYYYLSETTGAAPEKRDINTLEDPEIPAAEEVADPLAKVTEYPEQPNYEYHPIQALNLGRYDKDGLGARKTSFLEIPEQEFMSYVKSHQGSVNTTIAVLFKKAIEQCLSKEEIGDSPVVAGVAMSSKKLIQAEKSYANMVALANLEFGPELRDESIEALNELSRKQLREQTEPQNILYALKSRPKLVAYLKSLPDDAARKQTYYAMILRMKARDSFFVSYLGKRDWSSLENHIESIYVVSEADNHSMEINLYAVNGKFCIAMSQNFGTPAFINSFVSALSQENIPCTLEGTQEMILPKVRTTEIFS